VCLQPKNQNLKEFVNDEGWALEDEMILEETKWFIEARPGDHLMVPFQCDLCHFRDINCRDPGIWPQDKLQMAAIRRAILDSFWSRALGTVAANLCKGICILKIVLELKMRSPFASYPRGPYPVHDAWGVGFAVTQLHQTLDPGKNLSMIQWNTACKSRAFVSSYIHSTPTGRGMTSMAGNQKTFFSDSPTNALWMDRFYTGCHERMGDIVI
jgi:hypothetical protein